MILLRKKQELAREEQEHKESFIKRKNKFFEKQKKEMNDLISKKLEFDKAIQELETKKGQVDVAHERDLAVFKQRKLQTEGEKKRAIESLRAKLGRLKREHEVELGELRKQEAKKAKEIVAAERAEIQSHLNKTKQSLAEERDALKNAKIRFEEEKRIEKKKIHDRLAEQAHKEVLREVERREKGIRQELQNEFELNLKKKLQEHEDELNKQKLNLELEIQKRMKQVLS